MYEQRVCVEGIRFLSRRYFIVDFHAPQIASAARPGQFLMISVSDGIDPLLRRAMAFYRLSYEAGDARGFSLLVEKVGRGTALMAQARPGDTAAVLGPLGRPFCLPDPGAEQFEHLLVMGGVGAAPFPLLAAEMRRRELPVRAFVGGRSRQELLCVEDFESLGVPVEFSTDDGSAGHHGLVTAPLQRYLESAAERPRLIYSCGPTVMMRAVDRVARDHGVAHQVSLEAPMACGIGVCLSCVVRVRDGQSWSYRRICREGPVFDTAQLLW